MAIAIDVANLGTSAPPGVSASVTLNIGSAVASGGFIVVCAGNFGDHVTTASGGGLTWALDVSDDGSAGGNGRGIGIFSAQAPSGLAGGTTLTVNFSSSTPARTISAMSFTGVKTSSPLDVASGNSRSAVAAWATTSMSIQAGSVIVGMSWNEGPIASSTITAPSIEACDFINGVDLYGQTVGYRIESSAGSYTVAGAWNAAAGNSAIGAAYLAAPSGTDTGLAWITA